MSKEQLGLFAPQLPAPAHLDVTLARIRNIVGDECVGRAVLRDHMGRMHFAWSRLLFLRHSRRICSCITACRCASAASARSGVCDSAERSAEMFIFRERRYAVERAYGPWLAGGEWWGRRCGDASSGIWWRERNDGAVLCCCLVRDLMLRSLADSGSV